MRHRLFLLLLSVSCGSELESRLVIEGEPLDRSEDELFWRPRPRWTPPSDAVYEALHPDAALGGARVAVVLFNFQDRPEQPISAGEVWTQYFSDHPESSRTFFLENSRGRFSLTGDVYGWMTLPYNITGACDTSSTMWPDRARAEATSRGIDLSSYDVVAYVMAYTSACTFIGAWASQRMVFQSTYDMLSNGAANRIYTRTHELGHTLGLWGHANALDCGSVSIAPEGQCTWMHYGGQYSLMAANPANLNGAEKVRFGWLDHSEAIHVTGSGTTSLTLASLDRNDVGGARLATIPYTTPSGQSRSYFLEYRTSHGFNTYLNIMPWTNFGGVLWQVELSYYDGLVYPWQSALDGTPGDGIPANAMLDGTTMYDTENGIAVQQIAHDGATMTVRIARCGSGACWLDPCGDRICDYSSESWSSCPSDCPNPCGDGWCDANESYWSCPADCPNPCGTGIYCEEY
jgi:M6 family metalloprotease-like protein